MQSTSRSVFKSGAVAVLNGTLCIGFVLGRSLLLCSAIKHHAASCPIEHDLRFCVTLGVLGSGCHCQRVPNSPGETVSKFCGRLAQGVEKVFRCVSSCPCRLCVIASTPMKEDILRESYSPHPQYVFRSIILFTRYSINLPDSCAGARASSHGAGTSFLLVLFFPALDETALESVRSRSQVETYSGCKRMSCLQQFWSTVAGRYTGAHWCPLGYLMLRVQCCVGF